MDDKCVHIKKVIFASKLYCKQRLKTRLNMRTEYLNVFAEIVLTIKRVNEAAMRNLREEALGRGGGDSYSYRI